MIYNIYSSSGKPGVSRRDARVNELLSWFDRARVIVAYNGRDFDMRVLRGAYGREERRWMAHMAKLHDPMEAAHRAAGRRPRLSTLLKLNRLGDKGGTGCDAPRWWSEGRHAQLERYCARDTDALVELVARAEIRVPGGGTTREASVRRWLDDSQRARPATSRPRDEDVAEDARQQRARIAEADATPAATQRESRGKQAMRYDETNRRGPQRQRVQGGGYMERGTPRGEKRYAVEVGPAVMSRTTDGQYEWRDAGYKRPRRR